MGVRAHEGARLQVYFNILASSHVAFCRAPISSPATHHGANERGKRAGEWKLMSP